MRALCVRSGWGFANLGRSVRDFEVRDLTLAAPHRSKLLPLQPLPAIVCSAPRHIVGASCVTNVCRGLACRHPDKNADKDAATLKFQVRTGARGTARLV